MPNKTVGVIGSLALDRDYKNGESVHCLATQKWKSVHFSTFRKQGMQRAGGGSSVGRRTVKPGVLVCEGLGDLEDEHNRDVNG